MCQHDILRQEYHTFNPFFIQNAANPVPGPAVIEFFTVDSDRCPTVQAGQSACVISRGTVHDDFQEILQVLMVCCGKDLFPQSPFDRVVCRNNYGVFHSAHHMPNVRSQSFFAKPPRHV